MGILTALFFGHKAASPPPEIRTASDLIRRISAHLIRDGFAVAIDPDGVTAAIAQRTWRIVAVADDGGPAAPACRCHQDPWADTMPRKASATEMVRARLEYLEYHRTHPWRPEG